MNTQAGAKLWPWIGIIAAAVMWSVSAAANFWAGTQLAPSDAEGTALILGGASVSADLMKACALFIVIMSIASRRWAVTAMASVIFLLCVTWSMRSAVFFASSMIQERVAERSHSEAIQTAEKRLIELRSQRAGFISQQSIKLPGSGRPLRNAIVSERKRTASEFNSLTDKIEAGIATLRGQSPATGADPITTVFGVEESILFVATALAFAILVEVVSATAFWTIAQARKGPDMPPPPAFHHAQTPVVPSYGGGVSPASPSGGPSPGISREQVKVHAEPVVTGTPGPSNVVSFTGSIEDQVRASVQGACSDTLRPNPQARVLLRDVYSLVTDRMPPRHASKLLDNKYLLCDTVGAEVRALGGSKRKIGGKHYFVGVETSASSLQSAVL